MSNNREKKAVVLLGAGSSVPFGLPVLKDFFIHEKAQEYLKSKGNLDFRKKLEKFLKVRGFLFDRSSESVTIEEILTLLREIEYQSKEQSHDQHIFCDSNFSWEKIFKSTVFCKETAEKIHEKDPLFYENFRKDIYCLMEHVLFTDVTTSSKHMNGLIEYCDNKFSKTLWATYNWDCIFESSFYNVKNENPFLTIDVKDWWNHGKKHEFSKLHGGINFWLDEIETRPSYLLFSDKNGKGTVKEKWARYKDLEIDENGFSEIGKPLILEPSYYKYHREIEENSYFSECWCHFLLSMMKADIIFIVGYSLPQADQKARSALMMASQGNKNGKWIIVNPSIEACTQYERLLGSNRTYSFCKTLESFDDEFIKTSRLDCFL